MSDATRVPGPAVAARSQRPRAIPLLVLSALVLALAAASVGSAPPAGAVDPLSAFHTPAVTASRVLDTRVGLGVGGVTTPLAPDSTITLPLAGVAGIPANASAVVLNVTIPGAAAPGYVTVWPAGAQRPIVSNINAAFTGQVVANLMTTGLGGGAVAIYTQAGGHLVADVAGWYTPTAVGVAGGRYVPAPTPTRALDTRQGIGAPAARLRAEAEVAVTVTGIGGGAGVPADAEAVVAVVTLVDATAPGWAMAWSAGQARPGTSILNAAVVGQTVSNLVVVRPGAGGQVSLATQSGGYLVVDVLGWFTGPSASVATAGLFTPAVPTRVLDTRDPAAGALAGRRGPSSVLTVPLPAGSGALGAATAMLNVTVVDAQLVGVTDLAPPGPHDPLGPFDAADPARTVARAGLVPLTGGTSFSLTTRTGGHVLADLAGWYSA